MLTRYDKEIDTKYITFSAKKPVKGVVARTEKLESWLMVDYDKQGDVFGVEILDASKHPITISIAQNKISYFQKKDIDLISRNMPFLQTNTQQQDGPRHLDINLAPVF